MCIHICIYVYISHHLSYALGLSKYPNRQVEKSFQKFPDSSLNLWATPVFRSHYCYTESTSPAYITQVQSEFSEQPIHHFFF